MHALDHNIQKLSRISYTRYPKTYLSCTLMMNNIFESIISFFLASLICKLESVYLSKRHIPLVYP